MLSIGQRVLGLFLAKSKVKHPVTHNNTPMKMDMGMIRIMLKIKDTEGKPIGRSNNQSCLNYMILIKKQMLINKLTCKQKTGIF